ncbi:hypothetical protein KSP39_PZI004927 [Platanthera zijinensis]|uniref:Glutamine amidotransferase domain-containing protein n=1 Tax=Platanthera zijinensis TaxID=2320716 RepID=A0AAP0GC09_9ASPA
MELRRSSHINSRHAAAIYIYISLIGLHASSEAMAAHAGLFRAPPSSAPPSLRRSLPRRKNKFPSSSFVFPLDRRRRRRISSTPRPMLRQIATDHDEWLAEEEEEEEEMMRGKCKDRRPPLQQVRTLLIDNYDSYTYNIYQELAVVNGGPMATRLRPDDHASQYPSDDGGFARTPSGFATLSNRLLFIIN